MGPFPGVLAVVPYEHHTHLADEAELATNTPIPFTGGIFCLFEGKVKLVKISSSKQSLGLRGN